MNVTIERNVTYTATIDLTPEHEVSVSVPSFLPPTDEVRTKVLDNGNIRVAYLVVDEDAQWELPEDVSSATFQDEQDMLDFVADELEGFTKIAIGWIRDSRVFDCSDEYLALILPDDFTDPLAAARAIMGEWESYVAGECYGVILFEVTPDGQVVDNDGFYGNFDGVWGFIGDEYADEVLARTIDTGDIG